MRVQAATICVCVVIAFIFGWMLNSTITQNTVTQTETQTVTQTITHTQTVTQTITEKTRSLSYEVVNATVQIKPSVSTYQPPDRPVVSMQVWIRNTDTVSGVWDVAFYFYAHMRSETWMVETYTQRQILYPGQLFCFNYHFTGDREVNYTGAFMIDRTVE